jgi:hypothetical protein
VSPAVVESIVSRGKSAPDTSKVTVNVGSLGKQQNRSEFNYKSAFAEARNYWTYAHQILPAAKAGDADAQFYLSRVLERCAEDTKMYFQHGGRALMLDEGLRFAVQRHLPIDVAQSVYEKCHQFQENDASELGSASDWLKKATTDGQPIAQATTASKILIERLKRKSVSTGDVSGPNNGEGVDQNSDPAELLRLAVQSQDPEVFFNIGEAQGLLHPSDIDKNTNRFAWWLIACERGFDCSADATWVKNSCSGDPQCASISGPTDLVRTLSGDNWPIVQQRAQEIIDKLDAGQWSDLGIGS